MQFPTGEVCILRRCCMLMLSSTELQLLFSEYSLRMLSESENVTAVSDM
jgi:hypothetical protein